jgi:hypothetical protein
MQILSEQNKRNSIREEMKVTIHHTTFFGTICLKVSIMYLEARN